MLRERDFPLPDTNHQTISRNESNFKRILKSPGDRPIPNHECEFSLIKVIEVTTQIRNILCHALFIYRFIHF